MTIMSKIKKSKDIHAVLDIGNSKVSCLIGTIDKDNQQKAKVLGFGQHVSQGMMGGKITNICLLYTSPSPRDLSTSRMPSSA